MFLRCEPEGNNIIDEPARETYRLIRRAGRIQRKKITTVEKPANNKENCGLDLGETD